MTEARREPGPVRARTCAGRDRRLQTTTFQQPDCQRAPQKRRLMLTGPPPKFGDILAERHPHEISVYRFT